MQHPSPFDHLSKLFDIFGELDFASSQIRKAFNVCKTTRHLPNLLPRSRVVLFMYFDSLIPIETQ